MLDFFKTAAGSYNLVLIGGVFAWFASTWIIGANLAKHRSDTISAQKAALRSEDEKNAEEQRRMAADFGLRWFVVFHRGLIACLSFESLAWAV